MSYSRSIAPSAVPDPETLSSMMAGIGMNVATTPDWNANIEDTLYFASIEGMEHYDLRTLSLVTQWLSVHLRRVNADRIIRVVSACPFERVRSYWKAVAVWQSKDRRLVRLLDTYRGSRIDLLPSGTDFQISRRGEDTRFVNGPLRVPVGTLRERESDILSPQELASRHPAYRWRILVGPTYRADMLAHLENNPGLSASELARLAYGSFATAHEVKRDWSVLSMTQSV
ncbi:MAG: hypothetical protein ACOX51_12010 [Myxococcota bacterium]|jgi:hypothetical protein|nr:hypothetical protein [Myxococcota bacterium]MBP8970139.1 hypothetical protein [Myxococcota bacterium]HQL56756.1 hypothetical protein [Myxococcota bacterium]